MQNGMMGGQEGGMEQGFFVWFPAQFFICYSSQIITHLLLGVISHPYGSFTSHNSETSSSGEPMYKNGMIPMPERRVPLVCGKSCLE